MKKLLAMGLMLFSAGPAAHAQTHKKAEENNDTVSAKAMQKYKNVTQNGKPAIGFRFSDIQEGDTVVRDVFPYEDAEKKEHAMEIDEAYFKDPTHTKLEMSNSKSAISKSSVLKKTHVTPAGDTEKVYQFKPEPGTVFEYTKTSPGPHTPQKHAPKNLGEVNSNYSYIKESNVFANKEVIHAKEDTVFAKHTVKKPVAKVGPGPKTIRYTPGDILSDETSFGEESIPEKQLERFTNSAGPVLMENTGDARAFIRNNTSHFYEWLKHKKNWEHLTPAQWENEQKKWRFIKSKMEEVRDYTNPEQGAHDNVVFPESFNAVDMLMEQDMSVVGQALDEIQRQKGI